MKRATKADKAATQVVLSYVARYQVNRPFNAPECPSLMNDIMNGGRNVYNVDGGGTIASFSSAEAANRALVVARHSQRSQTACECPFCR